MAIEKNETALDKVTAALAGIASEGEFATEQACGSEDLDLEVTGVGRLRFPISARDARKLCAVAKPAPFGRREKTLLNKNVRNTWEIGKSRLKIDQRKWNRTLEPQLTIIRQRLGLSDESRLKAVLNKMLVYEPGQFFAAHQDSERTDTMIGSLVVVLPSTFSGGAVLVEHRAEKRTFRASKGTATDLSLLAFYADCHHAVQPIQSGYRIVLTYHLLQETAPRPQKRAHLSSDVDQLTNRMRAYFSTPVPANRYSKSPPERPDRLVYLLDHEYTQKSLAWNRLKNGDRLRVGALLEASERLACECCLALADVHEQWLCGDEDWGGRYGYRGRRRYSAYADESSDDGEYELVELCDSDIELRHFVPRNERRTSAKVASVVAENEVCFTKASEKMDPFKSEHEGWMGNYGNTVDRWYHRAAMVMWPRERNFVIRAKAQPSWAINELASCLKARATSEAKAKAHDLLPFWGQVATRETSATFFSTLLTVATALEDAELAHQLLTPFGPDRLSPSSLGAFIQLFNAYGDGWSRKLFLTWTENARPYFGGRSWLPFLPRLCAALHTDADDGRAFGKWLLDRETVAFRERAVANLRLTNSRFEDGSIDGIHDDLISLLESAHIANAKTTTNELVTFLTAVETSFPVMSLGRLLEKLRKKRTPAATRTLGVRRLYDHVVDALGGLVSRAERGPDDWSIEISLHCTCELCKTLSAFLRDPDGVEYAWPLAKERRRHIHGKIDSFKLPVAHTTVRTGSPHTLHLTKRRELFQRDANLRKAQKVLFASLRKQRSAF